MSIDSRLWLLAYTWNEATYYLSHLKPPRSPNDRRVTIIITDSPGFDRTIRGLRWREDDEIVRYGNYWRGKYVMEALSHLKIAGVPGVG